MSSADHPNDQRVFDSLAQQSSSLGIELVEVTAQIDLVAEAVKQQTAVFSELNQTAEEVARRNSEISAAAQAAQARAARSRQDARHSHAEVGESLSGIERLIGSVDDTARQIQGVTSALIEISRVTNTIKDVARQTNMLALNARIEAARAGQYGLGFAVVANEITALAHQAARATSEIDANLAALSSRCADLVTRSEAGLAEARAVGKAGDAIAVTFERVAEAMSAIELDAANISQAVGAIEGQCRRLSVGMDELNQDVQRSSDALSGARTRVGALLSVSDGLIRLTALSEATTPDTPYVKMALTVAASLVERFEAGLAAGEISEAELFDTTLTPIAGTKPQQYLAPYLKFTDRAVHPIIEPVLTALPSVLFCAPCDVNGYIGTHNLKYSKTPGADPAWNTGNCRNRRLFDDRVGKTAGNNRETFVVQTYRRDMGGGNFVVAKDVSAPILVRGRHWGGLRIGYVA